MAAAAVACRGAMENPSAACVRKRTMSGRGQHYIPRFLQAGFNSRPGEKMPRAWLYKKWATRPIETALTNIAKKRNFYQATIGDATLSADPAMTRAEGARLSGLVHELRAGKASRIRNSDGVAELFAHAQLRTRAAWFLAGAGAERFGRLIQQDMEVQGAVRDLMLSIAETMGDCFLPLVAGAGQNADQENIRQALAAAPLSEIFSPGPKGMAGNFSDNLVADVMASLKVWAMTRIAQHPESASEFQGCAFVLCEFPETRLVQGDTVVVYHKIDGVFTPILREGEVFDFAVLPLTRSRVLVASKGGMPESGEALQEASIRCAWNHFISDAKDEWLQALASTMGEDIPNITDGDIKEMLRAATRDEHWINCRAFLESPAYQAIRKKWVPWPWLRGDDEQNKGT